MEKQLSEKLPRVEVVDALRGFAVMAILLVHSLEHFIFPVYPVDQPAWLNILNDGVFNVTFTLLAGKSYAIFALLFGFTFYIQSANQQRKGKDFGYRFLWRLLLLVAFATLNAAFFPAGDVLLLFSVVGIVLFVVRKWSDCAILVTAILFLLQPVEWYHYIVGLFDPSHTLPDWGVGAMYKEVAEYTKKGNLWEFLGKNMTFGQKASLYWAFGAGLFICTAVGTGAVHSFTFFNVFRLVGGFAIGIASSLSPMYIAEIAPAHLRGRFVSINQLTVVLGILTSQIVNWQIAEPVALGATHEMIRESWNGQMGWRWMFWAMTVPAALFFVFSFILPESPRWLASSGKREAALKVFTRMGGKEYAVTELAAIEAVSACQTQEGGYRQLLNPAMYKVLTIGVVMAILQQWCGINVIFNYAQEIFMAAGYGVSDVLMNIVVTGITNVIFTILAMFVVDRWGRKALTLIGSFGLAVIYTFMGAAYYFHITGVVLLIIVVMAIACYAMTLATVMWVIISEIFPNRIRGVAMSVCTFALWAACFILTYTFPMLNSGLGAAGTFWLYGLICLAGGIFVVFRLPETKGKSLEEIEKELVK